MSVSGRTRVCAIIGDPVEHSISPEMHNAAFRRLRLDYIYVPFQVRPDQLQPAVDGLRALNIRGFNVTIPHKVNIIPMLDGLDPLAERIGAVNTVVNSGGELRGYNTDAEGFLRSLQETGVEPEKKSVVIIGAGGVARAIAYILAIRGAYLTIIGRHLDRAQEIATMIYEDIGRVVTAVGLNDVTLKEVSSRADILINATSVGMSPASEDSLVPASFLRPGMVVFDVVYNPPRTRLIREAEVAGARTIGGLEMLIWQGALAFEKWTGQPAPVGHMRWAALKMLS